MKLYLSVIGTAMALIAAVNILLRTAPWQYAILAVFWCTALQFALDGLLALLIHCMPDRLFGADAPLYRVSAWEQALYKKLKVRRWKDRIWELGGLGGFSKKALLQPDNPKYIEQFIIESNKGVLTHRLSYPIGFLAMRTLTDGCAWSIAFPVACVNLLLNILPTLALRYNTPKLQRMLHRLQHKQAVLRNGERKLS